jgi:hypothetical protein
LALNRSSLGGPVALDRGEIGCSTALVEEQLKAGHTEPTHSPWNIPIFVIRKKLGRWKLLQDLRAVNRVMQPMGALQPGLPSPTAILLDYCLCTLDLKDAFFTIPLHSKEKNLLSLCHHQIIRSLSADFIGQCCPKAWLTVPTMCQEFIAVAIEPTCHKYPEAYILHYMVEVMILIMVEAMILISHPSELYFY